MAYCCEDCGVIFEEAEERRHPERSGEELDPPSYHCPECGSEFYEEVKRCCVCEQHHPICEMNEDVCEDCLTKLGNRIVTNAFIGLTDMERTIAREKLELGDLFYA